MFANAVKYSEYKLTEKRTPYPQAVISYELQNTQLKLITKSDTLTEVCFTSGKHTKSKLFTDGMDVLGYVTLLQKYMLVTEAITHLNNVGVALARDCLSNTTDEGIQLDVILTPKNKLTSPKYKLIAFIPANDTLIATITFTERFWVVPTSDPVVHKFNARHFKTIHTFVDFIQKDRRG